MMEHAKVKSAAKRVEVAGPRLQEIVSSTMRRVAAVVGATLGPGGQPVLIERPEPGMPPMVTKDGVTVFRSLGFEDPAEHCIMEAMRDLAERTASEAGDGTTTATVLADSIGRHVREFCNANPTESPQSVIREVSRTYRDEIEPAIARWARKARLDSATGRKMLRAVARVSANGDDDLATAVMECFAITGDEGNVTIVEASGPSHYEVEHVRGYAIGMGYEQSAGRYLPEFVNDPGNQRCYLENPIFLLYHGRINEIQTVQPLLERVGERWDQDPKAPRNVVLCATGFSDTVLATLALNFKLRDTINVFPLLAPMSPQANCQLQFLHDLAAVTGARVLDPLSRPAGAAALEDLGAGPNAIEGFECHRFRSSVLGYADESLLGLRVDELNQMAENPESQLDGILLRERKAKLSGGIARLRVVGSSNGELKERRDRAEDAVCGVRGAIGHGVLPGGGWTLVMLADELSSNPINDEILRPALLAPVERLFKNAGISANGAIGDILDQIREAGFGLRRRRVYDFLRREIVDPYRGGLLDSTPAVREAIKNSLSIAGLLGTLGGLVVQPRDHMLERSEAGFAADWERDPNRNEADERP